METYTREDIEKLFNLYESGLARNQACAQVNIPTGSFRYLMNKFEFKTRLPPKPVPPKDFWFKPGHKSTSGFQKGNNYGVNFKPGPKLKINCKTCSKELEIPKCLEKTRKFCSRKCYDKDTSLRMKGEKHHNWKGEITGNKVKCKNCSKTLDVYQKYNTGLCRSCWRINCKNYYNRLKDLKCTKYSDKITLSNKKGPCRSCAFTGSQNPMWRGGRTIERSRSKYGAKKYKTWRTLVLQRDKNTCQICSKQDIRLHVHHIVYWFRSVELRYEVSNGLTLCIDCHQNIHRNDS